MKKIIRIIELMLAMMLICSFTGACAGQGTTSDTEKSDAQTTAASAAENSNEKESDTQKETTKAAANDSISIDDIVWTAELGQVNGVQTLVFSYTNNTPYTILDIELTLVPTSDVSEDQLTVFEGYTSGALSDVYLVAYNRKLCKSSETVSEGLVDVNGTYIFADKQEQLDVCEPSEMQITYVGSDDMIHNGSYDYETGKFSSGSALYAKYTWSDSEIASTLPKPEFDIVVINSDDEDRFYYTIYGVSQEDFAAYVENIKSSGYTENASEKDDDYDAESAEGYTVSAEYKATENSMSVLIKKK